MAISRTYGCDGCGHTWKHLHMSRAEPVPPCPMGCVGKPAPGLSAPSISRGAPDSGIVVPQTQGAREKLAADIALKHTGMADINSHMKPGDIAAKPAALPSLKDIPPSAHQTLIEAVTPKFLPAGHVSTAGATAPAVNGNILGAMGKRGDTPIGFRKRLM